MSNSQLEDRDEQEFADAVAAALRINVDELDRLDWSIEESTSDDGLIYGYTVTIGDDSDPEILSKIGGIRSGRLVRIAPFPR